MSDNSESEVPLPRDKGSDSDDSDSSSSSSSSSSSAGTNEIPIPDDDPPPNQNGSAKVGLDEIPVPDDHERNHDRELPESEIEIPLPPDSSKYSPSQATADDDMDMEISSTTEAKKSGPTVLGKAQAKKRLLAFSAAKGAAVSPIAGVTSSKKITPTKSAVVQKATKQEQQLAIETIKQEETKMREILAMNSILHQKLKHVNAITQILPLTPPVTAIVKPTVIAPSPLLSLPSLLDVQVRPPSPSKSDKIAKSPDRSRKTSKHIRKATRSESSSSRSHSRSSGSRSRASSAERRSSKRGRKSRSRSRDRKDKGKIERDVRDKKSKKSRSRSKERDSERRKKSRSRSKDRESDRHRHREKESKRSRKSKSRSRDREKEKDKRSTRKGSPEDERERAERSGRDRASEKDKLRSDRSRRDEEREKRAEEEKQLYEHEKELDKVRLTRLPIDWADFREHQYRHGDLRIVRRKINSEARTRSRSHSGSPSPSRPAEEVLQGTPLSKGSTFDLSTIFINSMSDIKVEYPVFLVQKTKAKPQISFGYTPLCSKGYYKTREKIFSEEDGDVVDAMKEIINLKPSTKDSSGKTEAREWFASTPQAFCPAVGGKQHVLISHLYSDEEKEESPAPLTKTRNSSEKSSKKKNVIPSPKAESMDEDDSMDSPPSPLLKRKYETPPSPVRTKIPKKKSKRSPPPSESEEEIPLCKDMPAVDAEKRSSKPKKRTEDKGDTKEKRDEVKDKRRGDTEKGEDKEKKRAEKDKKRVEKEKRREEKGKLRDEEKRIGEKEKDKKREEKRKKRDKEGPEGDDKKKDAEKYGKRDGEKVETEKEKKNKKSAEKEKDEDEPMNEKSSRSKDPVPEKTKEKKKKREKEKRAKKKHKKRQESSSSEPSHSPSPSSSSSSEESSDEVSDDQKAKSKIKKLKKKKKAKAKKEKSKTNNRDKSPDSSSDERDGKGGGGASNSKGGSSSRKDSHSRSRHDSRDRSRRDRSRERERDRDRRSTNYGRRRAEGVERQEIEDMMNSASPSCSYQGSEMETDMLMLMSPSNPLSASQLQHLDAEINSILDASKQTNSYPETLENTTHELLSVFDDDVLLQSVLQNKNISAEKLLMNISATDNEDMERIDIGSSTSAIVQKPFVSWSDDSEEEVKRVGETSEEKPISPVLVSIPNEPVTPASVATSGYETEKTESKSETTDAKERSEKPSPDHKRDRENRDRDHRDCNRRDYYDSRSRLLQAHVYDRRGRRDSLQERSSRDHRSGGRYYPSHRSSSSSHSHRYRDDRDRHSHSPDRDRKRRRYDDDEDRYRGRHEKSKEIKSDSREPGTVKNESPPVPDSTISDSELQSRSNAVNNLQQQMVGPGDGANLEYGHPSYYYNQAMTAIPGQDVSGGIIDDGGHGFGSPKRLSLDERLEIEMGLEKSQFLPVPRSDTDVPVSQIPILHMNRLHSQINLTGNVIQVVPIDIPSAPIVIRSTYPVATQFDIYGNPIGGPTQPGQYPRRVITIKVPVVPFIVPIMDPEALITKEPKLRRKRSSKHEKQKRKPSKLELERAKRKKGAEAKLLRRSKHREAAESHERQILAKESKVTESTTEENPAQGVKEVENLKDSIAPVESTPPPETDETATVQEFAEVEGKQIMSDKAVKEEPKQADDGIKAEEAPTEIKEDNVEPALELSPPLKKIEILPPPERGILVLLGFRDRGQEERKKVKFADGIDPGCGTSSSGGEELASPPPSFGKDLAVEALMKKKMKKKKKKKKKLLAEQTDLFAPPSCPKMTYPFCPPGILYQVCPQYALLYAHAMAEKGLDIVFEPTDEVPFGEKLDVSALVPAVQSQNPIPTLPQRQRPSTFHARHNEQTEVPLSAQPATTPMPSLPAGIDFSQPPPSVSSYGAPGYDYANAPAPASNFSPYEHAPPLQHVQEPVPYSYPENSSNYRHTSPSQYGSYYTPPQQSRAPTENGSKIPTIVNHQPVKVISPRSSKPPSSYSNDLHGDRGASVGQSIQVVTRVTTKPVYTAHEEHHHYNHTYNSSIPPPLISPHLEDVPPSALEYHHSNSNVLIPLQLHEEPVTARAPVNAAPERVLSTKKASKKETSKAKTAKSDAGGISIPLSKIISNSSIPSLAQNSPSYGSTRKQTPNQASSPHKPYSGYGSYSNFASFEFTSYNSTPSSNLISVTPQPISKTNLFEVPITETLPVKPKGEAIMEGVDLNAVPTSTTSTPSSTSPVKSGGDTSTSSPASSAFSGNYINDNDVFHHNIDNKYFNAKSELTSLSYGVSSAITISNVLGYTKDEVMAGAGDETPPPPGTSPY